MFFQWSPLWSYGYPLNFFFRPILKKNFYASNCFETIKNVFFHQNNHFELIERRFEKFFFQWSPLWSYGNPLNFFSTNFEKKIFMLQIALKPSKTFSFIKTIILK